MAYKATFTNTTPANPRSVTISSIAAGDILLAFATTDATGTTDLDETPDGFVPVGRRQTLTTDSAVWRVFLKVADGGETSVSFSSASGASSIGAVLVFDGVDVEHPLDVLPVEFFRDSGATTNDISITPVSNGCDLVYLIDSDIASSTNDQTFTFSTESGTTGSWTGRVDQMSGFYQQGAGTCVQTTAGAVTARCTFGFSSAAAGLLIALRPAGATSKPYKVLGQSRQSAGSSTLDVTVVTPTANSKIYAGVMSRVGTSTEPNTPTISATLGLTWAEVNHIYFDTTGSSRKKLTVFEAWTGSSPSGGTLTFSFGGETQTDSDGLVVEVYNAANATKVQSAVNNVASSTNDPENVAASLAAFASSGNFTMLWGANDFDYLSAVTENPMVVVGYERDINDNCIAAALYRGNDTSPAFDWPTQTNSAIGVLAFEISAASSINQEGFAWGDDGTETGHAIGTQDANVSVAAGTRKLLRVITDAASGDPASATYAAYIQKNGSGGFAAAPVGASTTTAPTFKGVGALSANTTTSITPALPTGGGAPATDDMIVVVIGAGGDVPQTAHGTLPTGYSRRGNELWYDYGPGGAYQAVFYKRAGASETAATFTFTAETGNGGGLWGFTFTVSGVDWDNGPFASASVTQDSNPGASTTFTPSGGSTNAANALVCSIVTSTDNNDLALTGGSENGFTQRAGGSSYATTVGSDGAFGLATKVQAAAGAVTMCDWTQTNVGADNWNSQTLCIKGITTNHEFYLDDSTNLTDGATTTARLTPPSGKTTSNHTPGRVNDTTNGSGATDIAVGNYAEHLFSFNEASSGLSNGDYWEVKVYANGSPLDTYGQVPRLTIGGGAITGTAGIAFSATGDLDGFGRRTGTVAVAFTPSATITGRAPITGTSALTVAPTGTMRALAAAAGSAAIAFSATATLEGLGSITGSAAVVLTPTGTLTALASITGTATATFAPTGALTGLGALAGSSTVTFTPTGVLDGIGELAGAAGITFTPTGTLAGNVGLTGSAAITFTPTAVLDGIGELAGVSAILFTPTGTLNAPASQITGAIAITITGTAAGVAKAYAAGTAALTITPTATLTALGALAGSASLTITPTATLTGLGELTGAAALTFTPSGFISGGGFIAGSLSVTFTPTGDLVGRGTLAGSASITITPTAVLDGLGELTGSAAIVFTPTATGVSRAAVDGAASIIFTPTGTLSSTGGISGTVPITITPTGALEGLGVLAGSSTLVFTALASTSNPIGGNVAITIAADGTVVGFGQLAGSANISVAALATLFGQAALQGSAQITMSPTGTLTSIGPIDGLAELAIALAGTLFDNSARRIPNSVQSLLSLLGVPMEVIGDTAASVQDIATDTSNSEGELDG